MSQNTGLGVWRRKLRFGKTRDSFLQNHNSNKVFHFECFLPEMLNHLDVVIYLAKVLKNFFNEKGVVD